jgi:hypothetical protein
MIIQPSVNHSTGEVKAKTTFLSPHFEEGRVRMLGIPSEGELDIIVWEEHWNPYSTLKQGLFPDKNATLMVDEEIRDFLVRGLDANGFKTVGLGGEVEAVRQTKTPAEIELLRAVNTGRYPGDATLSGAWIDRKSSHTNSGQHFEDHRVRSLFRHSVV